MINDFRLWGSMRCRQTNAPPKKPRWRVWVARAFNNRNASFSEGGALAVVVKCFPGTSDWTRDNADFAPRKRHNEARLRLACLPLVRRNGAQYERGAGGGSDPRIFVAGASPARVNRRVQWRAINPPVVGVAPSTVIPGGKTIECCSGLRLSTRAGHVAAPVIHEPAPALEQVGAGIGRLDPILDHMRQGRLNHLPGMVGFLSRPVPEAGATAVISM